MSAPDALFVNGTDIESAGVAVAVWDNVDGTPDLKGSDVDDLPQRDGSAASGRLKVAPRVVMVGVILLDVDDDGVHGGRAQMKANWRTLRRLIFNDAKTFTLRRDVTLPGGVESVAATCRYLGDLTPEDQAAHIAKCAFHLKVLDGYFYDLADTVTALTSAGGTVTTGGDATTRRLTLTFSGKNGAAKLTNTTTGQWVQVNADTTATPIVVTVDAGPGAGGMTATQGGANMLGALTSADEEWMSLAPGDNVFTLSAGACSVAAKAAHL